MLKVKDLTKYYDDERILNRISFRIEREHKIALVGFNGVGKTTLLRILADLEKADKGQIEFDKKVTTGFLPQDYHKHDKQIVIDYLKEYTELSDDDSFRRDIEIMLAGFVLDAEIKNKRISDLSSGQKTKIFLIAILLKKPNLLLLDEPTNNLDLPALIWLENYLQKYKSAIMVISHDKKFLDNICNKVYEIDWKDRTLEISNGKYSDYLIRKEKEKDRQQLDHDLQQEDIKRLDNLGKQKQEKAARGAKYVSPDNDRMLQGYRRNRSANSLRDSKVIFNRIKRMDKINAPNIRKDFVIDIEPEDIGDSRDIKISNLVCGYEDFEIGPIDLEIKNGERVCILGLNGSGKTTLLKTLTGIIPQKDGEIEMGEGVHFGNLMQEYESLPNNKTPIQFLSDKTKLEKERIKYFLDFFGFSEKQFENKISLLSSGGKARLLLSFFSMMNVNTLILDEPTNHLDREAENALKRALDKFKGTVLVVTHDRFFVEGNMIKKLFLLEEGKLTKIKSFKDYVSEMEKRSKKLIRMLK